MSYKWLLIQTNIEAAIPSTCRNNNSKCNYKRRFREKCNKKANWCFADSGEMKIIIAVEWNTQDNNISRNKPYASWSVVELIKVLEYKCHSCRSREITIIFQKKEIILWLEAILRINPLVTLKDRWWIMSIWLYLRTLSSTTWMSTSWISEKDSHSKLIQTCKYSK